MKVIYLIACTSRKQPGLVADQLGRDAVLIDIKPAYAKMSYDRIRDDCPMFVDVTIKGDET